MRELAEKVNKNTPAIERFRALCRKGELGQFPVGLLEGVLNFGIDVAKAERIMVARISVLNYESIVSTYNGGEEMLEIGRTIGQELVNTSDPKSLIKELRELNRLALIHESDRIYGGDY